MDVDHAVGIGVEDIIRHAGQEARQDHEVDAVCLQRLQDGTLVRPLLLIKIKGRHVQVAGALQDVGRLAVGQH